MGTFNGSLTKRVAYDAEGNKWEAKGIESPYKRTWWMILLAKTVYSPIVDVTVIWRRPKPYALEELKSVYTNAVRRDDDILTQFVEGSDLMKRISEAESFEQLVRIYEWANTDHGDE